MTQSAPRATRRKVPAARAMTLKSNELLARRRARVAKLARLLGPVPTLEGLLAGRTVAEVAGQAGVTRQELERWLAGKRELPRVGDGLAVALALGVDPYVLVSYLIGARMSWLKELAAGRLRRAATAQERAEMAAYQR